MNKSHDQCIGIIDYGLGNLASVHNMLKKLGIKSIISANIDELKTCDKLILPGVGSFGMGMQFLKERSFIPMLNEYKESGRKIIGICLGMQLLGSWSEEGDCEGLGFIPAEFKKIKFTKAGANLIVPHMGWNYVKLANDQQGYTSVNEESRFYFVHSYYADNVRQEHILMTANYGEDFVAAFQDRNIVGFQFHPEKSHKYGMALLTEIL